jgi:chromosome segregation ATPase
VTLAEEEVRLYKAMKRADKVQAAEKALAEARRLREEALPPVERPSSLRDKLTGAEGELARREQAVASTELELDHLDFRLAEERAAVVDQEARVRDLHATIEAVELQVPPVARPHGAQGAQGPPQRP